MLESTLIYLLKTKIKNNCVCSLSKNTDTNQKKKHNLICFNLCSLCENQLEFCSCFLRQKIKNIGSFYSGLDMNSIHSTYKL